MQNSSGNHYAIIYQITQECPFNCGICLRFYDPGSSSLSAVDRTKLVDILKNRDVKSISVTGGEPLILKDDLFHFLEYLHKQHIHTCLASTGYKLSKNQLLMLDKFLDRLVISIRSLKVDEWKSDFGDTKETDQLYGTVINILEWIKFTNIVLEVTTVLHKEGISRVFTLGKQLAQINPNIVWRIDEYYPIGKEAHNHERFELTDLQFIEISRLIKNEFSTTFKDIRFSSWADRRSSPGLFVTQSGDIMTSDGNPTGFNIMRNEFPDEFKMSRPWSDYKKVFRDWGWGDF